MKSKADVFAFIAILLFLLTSYPSTGDNIPTPWKGSENNYDTSVSITRNRVMNNGFEEWTYGTPDGWLKVMESVGTMVNNIRLNQELIIKSEGNFSVRVESIQPCGGISHSIADEVSDSWNIYPSVAKAAVHYAKTNGTSAFFTEHSLVQENFELSCKGITSTAIRNAHALRLDNGDFIELFSACTFPETSGEGAIYIKRNGEEPSLFLQMADHKTWTWPGVMDMGDKYVIVTMRIGQDGQTHIYATDVTRDFATTYNDHLLFEIPNMNMQCYRMLKLPNNTIVMPIVYASPGQVYSGPWYLDILTTTDFTSVTRLNQQQAYIGKGLMEAYPVLLSDGKVAVLCRTNQGHLAKAIYDPVKKKLSEAVATGIIQPEAGSFAMNLSDNSILLSWLANIDFRKVLVMAVSDDDMATWQSYHILMTSEVLGHSMISQPPYVHQPYAYEDSDGALIYYFEEVITHSIINLYKTTSTNYRLNNVANRLDEWQEITVAKPDEATSVQLLNIIGSSGIAYFDQPVITAPLASILKGIEVYPNPVDDYLHISTVDPITGVDVMDIQGRVLRSFPGSSSILMNEFRKGIYFIRVRQGLKVHIAKIVKL